jgi:hypothetical protein
MAYVRMAFGRMAFGRMAFGYMAFGRMTLGRMASQSPNSLTKHNEYRINYLVNDIN